MIWAQIAYAILQIILFLIKYFGGKNSALHMKCEAAAGEVAKLKVEAKNAETAGDKMRGRHILARLKEIHTNLKDCGVE